MIEAVLNFFPKKRSHLFLSLSFLLVLIAYPAVFFFRHFPMHSLGWELQDPVSSIWNYVPSLRVIRYEFLHRHNWLWSSLRGMGMPILANEVQGAPFFPLTLALLWVPEPYFWNVFVVVRLALVLWACFLLASRLFRFSDFASFVFTVCFGLSVYLLRFLNHPWLNGVLAGLWCFYFVGQLLEPSERSPEKWWLETVLLALSVFSVITCGFPESTAMMGIVGALLFAPLVISRLFSKEKKGVLLVGIGVVSGVCLASLQILALSELVSLAGAGYRTGFGLSQFSSLKALIPMVSRLESSPEGEVIRHYFNLIPLFLFFCGIASVKSLRQNPYTLGIGCCLLFGLFKLYPLFPAFNQMFAHLPVLKQSWFIVYFLPLILFPFAFFAGVGAEFLEKNHVTKRKVILGAFLTVCALLIAKLVLAGSIDKLRSLKLVILFVLSLVVCLSIRETKRMTLALSLLLVLEFATVRPVYFSSYKSADYKNDFSIEDSSLFHRLLIEKGINPLSYRERSYMGAYVANGIATLDNGSPGVTPERLSLYRQAMFDFIWEGWKGQVPISNGKFPHSFALSSVGLYPTRYHSVDKSDPKFELLGKLTEQSVYFDKTALPRTYLASQVESVSTSEEALKKITNKKFVLGTAVLETESQGALSMIPTEQEKVKEVAIKKDSGSSVVLAPIQGPGVLVFNDPFYPGWKAVDEMSGKEFKILPANYLFRGVILPEGTHQISFHYEPGWLIWGMGLVALGILILLMTGAVLKVQGRQSLR